MVSASSSDLSLRSRDDLFLPQRAVGGVKEGTHASKCHRRTAPRNCLPPQIMAVETGWQWKEGSDKQISRHTGVHLRVLQ